MLPRFLLTLMTRIRSSCPFSASRLRTGRTSIWLPGRNARTPMSTASPPLIRSTTRPMTTLRSAKARSTSSQIFIFSAFSRESTMWPSRSSVRSSSTSTTIALADDHGAGLVEELVDGDDAFGLVADVDHDLVRGDFQYGALDDFSFRDVAEAVIVKVEQAGKLLGADRLIVFGPECGGLGSLPPRGREPSGWMRPSARWPGCARLAKLPLRCASSYLQICRSSPWIVIGVRYAGAGAPRNQQTLRYLAPTVKEPKGTAMAKKKAARPPPRRRRGQ